MVDTHKHCPICGMPIPLKEVVCSDKCQQILIERENKIRKTRLMLYGVFAIFIFAWVILTFFYK
jgi:predicted nucleic acid-binding Zn ribbon protein